MLIVEDNLINQTVLKRQLIKAGLSCNGESSIPTFCDSRTYLGIVASNGLEALNIIRETHRQHRRGVGNTGFICARRAMWIMDYSDI